jgi:hypothetical protein
MHTLQQFETKRRKSRRVGAVIIQILFGLTLVGAGQSASAQAKTTTTKPAPTVEDARWYPWIGCWERSGEAGASAQLTCVRPSTGASADIMTIANGVVESREHLVVDGQPHPIDKDGCHGSQTATWSASGNRIYVGSAYSCSGSLHGRSTRMFAILPSGVWLDVRDVHAGGGWVETMTRFHDVGLPNSVPADVRSQIAHHELAAATARAAASAPVASGDIAEAMRAVDTAVVQSWLSARGQASAGEAGVAHTGADEPRVYYGSATPAPQPQVRTEYPLEPACDAFGCYEMNGYSTYNGYNYSPYARPYMYGYGPTYFVPYAAPFIVVRGGTRGHGPVSRPPVVHNPVGHRPVGQLPFVQNPVSHGPSGVPRGGVPGRGRP